MGRIFKVLALLIGAVIVLFVAVLLAIGLLFDPNDYKDEITAAVADATGRTVTLEGDLDLTLFPRLGIVLGAAELSNAEGFGPEPFARIGSAELRVGILPLLSRRVEIDRASLSGLRLNLARNAAGMTNWDDLARGDDAAVTDEPGDAEPGGADLDLSVGAIDVDDAEVAWRDAATNQDWVLSNFHLEATDLGPGRAFPLSIGFSLAGADVDVAVESEMVAEIRLATSTYRLDDLSVALSGEGEAWPGGSGNARLAFASFVANLDEQSVLLEGLDLEMLGLSISGDLEGQNIMDDLSLAGGIEIATFDPRELMSAFDTAIETADPSVLGRASARAEFYYGSAAMGMRDMTLVLDDSTLMGTAGLRGERIEFDLVVDAINIDRYLPPPVEGEAEAAPGEGSIDEVDLPIDPLRNFEATGNLALNEAQFLGMMFDEANFALNAGNGRMTVTPTGMLYGGALDGEITVEVQGDAARLALRQAIVDVDMEGLARDFLKLDSLVGTGNVNLNLAASGRRVGEIKRGLDGTASIAMTDGAWLGIDVWHAIRRARAVVGGPDVAPIEGEPRTNFERIAIAGNVEDAVLTTNEFVARLPFAALDGQGTVDLLTYELDIRAGAALVDGPVLQEDPAIAEYAGARVPLTIGGTIDAPDIGVDWRGMLSSRAQQEVDEEVDEAREELDEEVDEAREEVEERLRDRLRGILER